MGGSGEKWKKSKPSKYSIDENGELVRKGKECPKCSEEVVSVVGKDGKKHSGVFMGEHSDRQVCGRCGYSTTGDSE